MASFTKYQFALAATTLTTVFTCPHGKTVPVTLYLCNRDAAATTFRISIAIANAADATEQYIYYDARLPANDALKESFTMNEDDVLRVYTAGALVSCSVFTDLESTLAP